MKKALKIVAVMLVAVMSLTVLAACGAPNSDPEKALANLKEAGYVATKLPALGIAGAESVVSGTKTEKDDEGNIVVQHVTIYYFESAEKAEEAWETIKNKSNSDKNDNTDWVIASSGKMIWYGTSAAIKAAK